MATVMTTFQELKHLFFHRSYHYNFVAQAMACYYDSYLPDLQWEKGTISKSRSSPVHPFNHLNFN